MVRLRRTSPEEPGWTRRRAGRGFVYLDEHGERLPEEEVSRIRSLAIPPAWRDVWISPHPHGHLQAVGTDEAGRRQYLYHPHWRTRRDAEKFDRVERFGEALGTARPQVLSDLQLEGMPLERACALAVRLLDLGCFRIGNDVYLDRHGSFGLTTLQREHVRRRQDRLVFSFTGKSGVEHQVEIDDPGVVAALEVMRRRRAADDRTSAPGTPPCWPPPRSPSATGSWSGRGTAAGPRSVGWSRRRCGRSRSSSATPRRWRAAPTSTPG
jgi:DNA topoisomerase IB